MSEIDWDTEPMSVGRYYTRRDTGTRSKANSEEPFYAIITPLGVSRKHIPSKILNSVRTEKFVDHRNPFYPDQPDMVGIRKNSLHNLRTVAKQYGYELEVRHDCAPFKFLPRLTTGVVVIR